MERQTASGVITSGIIVANRMLRSLFEIMIWILAKLSLVSRILI